MVPPHGSEQLAKTDTVADCRGEVPPDPVHWRVKVESEVRGSVRPLPERFPEVDQFDDVVQLVALVELHVSVDRPPLATAVGEIERVTVGAGVIDTVTDCRDEVPPGPVH